MSESSNGTQTKTSDRPASKKASSKRSASSDGDCLAASFFALKAGSIENAKKAVHELSAAHAETMAFVIECGGVEEALERLEQLAERVKDGPSA